MNYPQMTDLQAQANLEKYGCVIAPPSKTKEQVAKETKEG